MNHTVVVIPTYNERESVIGIVARVLARTEVDVLIVDDNSPDGTGVIADQLAVENPRVHVLHRTHKRGLGTAYCEGFAWGLERGYQTLVELDGDGSHAPEELHRLLDRMPFADLVLGSRWVSGGSVIDWPLRRVLLSRAGSLYARCALRLPYRDITGGYRAFSADALRRIDTSTISSQGYCFQIDMLWHAHNAGLRVEEVPITFVERTHGTSKMSVDIVFEAMWKVTGWGVRSLVLRARKVAAGVFRTRVRDKKFLAEPIDGNSANVS